MQPDLPLDLRAAIAAISERCNACRLISVQDVDSELPARDLTRGEIEGVLQALADQGIFLIEDDAADHLARRTA